MSVTRTTAETTYTYDTTSSDAAQNALTSIAFPGGTHQYFTYDNQGSLASTYGDGDAQTQTFAYSAARSASPTLQAIRPICTSTKTASWPRRSMRWAIPRSTAMTPTQPDQGHQRPGASATYTYNAAGEVTSSTDFLGNTTTFAYCGPLNQLAALTDANGNTTRYSYNSAGDLLRTTYANSTSETFTYNPQGNATVVRQRQRPADQLRLQLGRAGDQRDLLGRLQYTYTYDSHGNLLTATDATGTTTFTYDPTTEHADEVAYPNGTSLTFSYNAAGQRSKWWIRPASRRITATIPRAIVRLTDGSGNLIVTLRL